MKLFDLHCDTLLAAYQTNQPLHSNNLHIAFDKAEMFDKYSQILAIFSSSDLTDDEAYSQFLNTVNYYNRQKPKFPGNFTPYLAVEGANLLANDISRLDVLHDVGVKFLTLVWGGDSCVGGAHQTNNGLTEFGTEVVGKCFESGIIPDLSHASRELFWQVIDISDFYGKPVVATHSNSYQICPHSRNLTDEMFIAVKNRGGIVGLSMYAHHLSGSGTCTIDNVISHIEHYLSLGGEDVICMGCDFDGIDKAPDEINDISDLYKIYDGLSALNYSDELIDKIFYDNAQNFIIRNG